MAKVLLRSWPMMMKRRKQEEQEGIEVRSKEVDRNLVGTLFEVLNLLMTSDLTCVEEEVVVEKAVGEGFEDRWEHSEEEEGKVAEEVEREDTVVDVEDWVFAEVDLV